VMPFHRLFGDFNGDARVDSIDFVAFRTAFGTVNTTFDLDGDGHVGASDFVRFREVFGLWI
jgi:Dockerin type I domain